MSRVVVYGRTSTEDQAERETVQTQVYACREHAEREGWEVVGEYLDEGVSGTIPLSERPAGTRLLAAAEAKQFDRVLVHRLDRLGRDVLVCLVAMKRLEALRTPVVSIDDKFDDTPSGEFARTVIMAAAQLERALIAERTKDGRLRKAREGKYLSSHVPFGYTRVDGKLEIEPQRAETIRLIYKWCIDGMGVRAIAGKLEAMGIEPSNPSKRAARWNMWHPTSVHKLLTNTRYMGKATYTSRTKKGGKVRAVVEVSCPALVDEDTFQRAQAALKQHKRNSPRSTQRFYLLQHLTWCRACGSRYTWRVAKDKVVGLCRRRLTYATRAPIIAEHDHVVWRVDGEKAETAIKKHLLRVLADPNYIRREIKLYRDEAELEVAAYRAQEERLQTKLSDLERQEQAVLEGWERGGVYRDDEQVRQRLVALRDEQEETTKLLAEIEVQVPMELSKSDKLLLVAEHARSFGMIVERGIGALLKPRMRKGWEDKALTELEKLTEIRTWVPDPDEVTDAQGVLYEGAQEPTLVSVPINEWWRDLMGLIDRIWVEPDGRTLVVEGTLKVVDDRISLSPSNR